MPKLLKLYEDILDYCSMTASKDGKIRISFLSSKNGDEIPVLLDEKRLVMPVDEQFSQYDPEKVVIFHPLQEYTNRGESEVVKALRYQLNVRINYTVLAVASALLEIIASPALHRNLTPEQRELLIQLRDADIAAAGRFMEFAVKRFSNDSSRLFANIYLKKAGTYKGEKHSRVGVVQFPIYEILNDPELKLKKGDAEIFRSLIEFIFPGSADDTEAYNSFSDHRDAPWLDCLLKTSYNLTSRLNELLDIYKGYIDDVDQYVFNTEWLDELENIEAYRAEIRRIPPQKGNHGVIEEPEKKPPTSMPAYPTTQAPTVVPAPRQPVPQQPAQPQQPVYPPPNVNMAAQVIIGYDPYGRPIYGPAQAPMPYQQPMPQQQGLQVTDSGKLSFDSVVANNPVLAASPMVQTPLTEWHQQQMMQQAQPVYVDPRFGQQPYQQVYQQPYPPGAYMDPRMVQQGYVDPRYVQQAYVDPRFNQGYAAPMMPGRYIEPV